MKLLGSSIYVTSTFCDLEGASYLVHWTHSFLVYSSYTRQGRFARWDIPQVFMQKVGETENRQEDALCDMIFMLGGFRQKAAQFAVIARPIGAVAIPGAIAVGRTS